MNRTSIAATLLLVMAPVLSEAQVAVTGHLEVLAKNGAVPDYTNITFKDSSPYHTLRARLFFDAPLDENNAAFVQVLFDNFTVNLYGAYFRMGNVVGEYINFNIGLIPSTIGNYAPRTYSNVNPLIGTPLLWVHHSSWVPVATNQPRTVDEMLVARDSRTNMGLPVLYDNCWNTGVELYGSAGSVTYSVAALSGSVTKPRMEQSKDMPQITTRFAYVFGPSLTVGVSAFGGPYLWDGYYTDDFPEGETAEDYMNYGGGYDLAFARGYLEIYSETFFTVWEHPYLADLKAASGYLEAKYKFMPGWYAAARAGFFEPGKLTASDGSRIHWDYPVKQYEFGVGYHVSPRIQLKAVTKLDRWDFTDEFDTEHYALQLSAVM